MRGHLVVATALAIACVGAFAQAYRWVDDQGRVHYTQTPPPPGARDVQRKNLEQTGVPSSSDLPYATQLAAKKFPVKLYAQKECAPCDETRASLVKRSVPFSEISVVTQKDLDEVKTISGKADLPLLVVGALFQSGFQEDLINSLLDTAGYPSAGSHVPLEALRKPGPTASSVPPAPEAAATNTDSTK